MALSTFGERLSLTLCVTQTENSAMMNRQILTYWSVAWITKSAALPQTAITHAVMLLTHSLTLLNMQSGFQSTVYLSRVEKKGQYKMQYD